MEKPPACRGRASGRDDKGPTKAKWQAGSSMRVAAARGQRKQQKTINP